MSVTIVVVDTTRTFASAASASTPQASDTARAVTVSFNE
jgi:hypothetical protein